MGASYSSPTFDDMDGRGFDAVLTRSVKFGSGDAPGAFRSVSFNGRDTKQAVMKSFGSGKLLLEGSLSFHGRDLDTVIAIKKNPFSSKDKFVFDRSTTDSFKRKAVGDCQSPLLKSSLSEKQPSPPPSPQSDNCRHQAALKLQKVYKSFRIRRQLADCAVLVEQKWWKLLDFAELKRSSISFFEIEKPETAVTRWSRARTKAAKVGKGLSKDEKARKLALQHWLEAIDPRHRYGHNLQFYYVTWLKCDSREPFFYWLDIGEGKEVNLVDRCCRSKLQQQCIKYLGPIERTEYEVEVKNGKFYRHTGELLDTRVPKDVKWIFVLSTSKTFYVGQKNKGTFQHSSFLAGGATLAAGRLVVEDGILKAIWPHSGHYLPTEENFDELMCFLDERGIDLTIVKKSPCEEEEEHYNKKGSEHFQRRNQSTAKLSQDAKETNSERSAQNSNANEDPKSKIYGLPIEVQSTLAKLKIPKRNQLIDPSILEESPLQSCGDNTSPTARPSSDGYETAEESFLTEQDFIVPKLNLFGEDVREADELPIPREAIMQRINLHRRTSSYQLAQRLSCTWTTGAGPRISCVRDYPSRLQSQVLEQVNLSPRATQSPLNTIVLSIFSDEKTMRKSLLGPLQ